MTEKEREELALLRYGLISEFLDGRIAYGAQEARMQAIVARKEQILWQGAPLALSVATLKRWLSQYRRLGLAGLMPQERADKGICRAIDEVLQERIVAIKRAMPSLSIPELIRSLEDAGEAPPGKLKRSTVHRMLQQQGLSARGGRSGRGKAQRLPYIFPNPLDQWQGDVMHGRVRVAERKIYLIAFLDNASRAVMHAAFCHDERTVSLLRVFRQAVLVRGIPKRVYVDHGSAYVDSRFRRTCAHLGVQLQHAPVGDAAAKGMIERWFGEVRRSFEAFLQPGDLEDLEDLNSLLWDWIETHYHRREHGALDGRTPWERFLTGVSGLRVRRVDPALDFEALWRVRESRKVQRDGTVSLNGRRFEVPPTTPRERVELRYLEDDFPENVEVWTDRGKEGMAILVDREANRWRRRWRPQGPQGVEGPLPIDPLSRARRRWDPER